MLPEQITTTKLNDSTFGKDIIAVINGQQQQQSGHQSNSTNNITVIKFIETQHHHHRHRHQSKTIASFDADSSVESDAVGPSESHCRDESNSIQRSSFIFCDISNWISYQDNIADVHHRKGRRLNGFQLPLHPLQVFGWCVLVFFAIASFSILIPHFSVEIRGPLYGFIAGLYIVHVVSHLIAVLIDPADRELRRLHRNDRIVPEFNRAKHAHVIENGRCHLCNIRTSSQRTKHCSVCNKCVGKFDHHCKWLNHCIGSRNYVAFLMCVVSAVIATLVILAAAIAQIILYHFNPEWLSLITKKVTLYDDVNNYNLSRSSIDDEVKFMMNSTDFYDDANSQTIVENGTMDFNDTLAFAIDDKNITQPTALVLVTSVVTNGTATTATTRSTGIGLNNTMFLIFVGFIGVLAAITAGLLLHLCFFHIYISFLGLTTYEYIRNHRQQANVKSTLSTIPKNETAVNNTPNIDPSIEDLRQIYFCSNLSHPNSINMNYQHLFDANGKVYETDDRPTSLHCCANSREYHQTAMKTYYMCSTLEGDGEGLSVPVASPHHQLHNDQHQGLDELFSHQSDDGETYHCCSKFTSKAEIGTTSSTSSSTKRRHSYLQFTEQCSFCTLRIRPSVAGRKIASSVVAQKIDNATPTTFAPRSAHDHQRCCGKTISKHHRWRRKWNCCSSVPDSPDVPNDIITAFAMEQQRNRNGGENRKSSSSQIPVHFIKSSTTTNDRDGATDVFSINSQRSVNNLKASSSRGRFGRPWPVGRLRHMIRMINRYRRPQCQHNNNTGNTVTIAASSIKQNQIRPLYSYSQQYDSSSPPPPSSTSTTTTSDRSDRSICSDQSLQTIETILPTSVIRDETSTTYIHGLTMPPALPPPTRRRIPNPTNLEELAETLRFSHIPISNCSSSSNTNIGTPHRLPSLNSVYRRQRRKHFLRTRSPTLSPIHESGLSNPTSPQPCRHTASNCSPAVVINNICSQMAKTSSNGSLNSSSSNSSSTSAN